jgi:hypothetical protein
MTHRRIELEPDGRYRLQLPADERQVLRSLSAQLLELLGTDDPSLARLFPPAYTDDEQANEEFGQLVRGELLDGKVAALRVVAATADADLLDEAQLNAWLGALESLRLVLGTQLDVNEGTYAFDLDPSDPRTPAYALYGYLSWLQEQAVDALSAGLP